MDFVVVGFGLGALTILAAVVLLGWHTARWERAAARATSSEDAAHCRAAAASVRGLGQALLYAGGALLLATAGALTASLDDSTGAMIVATTATVAVLGLLLWAYLHRSRIPALASRTRQPSRSPATAGLIANPQPLTFLGPPAPDEALAEDDLPATPLDGEDRMAAHANGSAATAPDGEDEPAPAPDPPQAEFQVPAVDEDHGAGNGFALSRDVPTLTVVPIARGVLLPLPPFPDDDV